MSDQQVHSAPLKRMTSSTAKHLEALISIHQDFRYVMQVTHAAVTMLEGDVANVNHLLLQTYWSAALNAYARSFNDGVRGQKAKPEIFSGIEGALESHDYFIKQRDKLIAHSVNPFEDVAVGVFLDTKDKVIGVGELSGRLVATSIEGFRDLNQLAKIATEHLKQDITNNKEQLLKEAKRLPVSELRRLADVKYVAPSPDKSGISRRSSL